jgi:hypothetical protein
MPSSLHEALLELFRNRPVLACEVLARCLEVDLPEFKNAELAPGDLPKLRPAERRADAVVILRDEQDQPSLAIVVEVQLKEDGQKRKSWPDYLTGLFSRHDCPAVLLVVCAGQRIAAWAAEPIAIGHPRFVLRPLVLGPDLVPVITDRAEAMADPELAVLSGIAHGVDKAVREAAFTAVATVAAQDADLAALYADVIVAELPKALRKTAEEELRARTIEYQSDFARSYVAQGKAEGKAEGLAEGKAEGLAEGKAEDVLTVLRARGIKATPAQQAEINQCTDLSLLDAWLRRAVTANSADDIFA